MGKAIVYALVNKGAKVIFTYNRKQEEADAILAELGKDNVTAIKVDFHSDEQIANLFAEIDQHYDHLDILVNNAGINRPRELFGMGTWREMFQVDLFAPVAMSGEAVKRMKDGGKILNITSIYANPTACDKNLAAYGAAKAALEHFTKVLAKNVAPKILVNAIAPGYVQTPLWINTTEEEFKDAGHDQLIDRMIQPGEIAYMAIAILENDAITGEIVTVDGGLGLKTI